EHKSFVVRSRAGFSLRSGTAAVVPGWRIPVRVVNRCAAPNHVVAHQFSWPGKECLLFAECKRSFGTRWPRQSNCAAEPAGGSQPIRRGIAGSQCRSVPRASVSGFSVWRGGNLPRRHNGGYHAGRNSAADLGWSLRSIAARLVSEEAHDSISVARGCGASSFHPAKIGGWSRGSHARQSASFGRTNF